MLEIQLAFVQGYLAILPSDGFNDSPDGHFGQVHGLCSRVKGLCRGGSAPMRGPPVLEEADGEGEGGVAELRPPPLLFPPLLVPGTPDPVADTPGPPSLFLLPALALSVIFA